MRQSKKKKGPTKRRQQRHNPSTFDQHWAKAKASKVWIPKERLAHMNATEGNAFVRIQGRCDRAKGYKEWIVPQSLIEVQGYYEGQSQMWLPKASLQQQEGNKFIKEARLQPSNQIKQQWRPKAATPSPIQSAKVNMPNSFQSYRQVRVPKVQKGGPMNQDKAVKPATKWVPKKPAAESAKSSKPTPTTRQQWIPKRSPAAIKEAPKIPTQKKDLPPNKAPSQASSSKGVLTDFQEIRELTKKSFSKFWSLF